MASHRRRWTLRAIELLCLGIGVWGAWSAVSGRSSPASTTVVPADVPRIEEGILVIPRSLADSMVLRSEPVRSARSPLPLRLRGQLALDPARLVHVASRFGGEVVRVSDHGVSKAPLRVGQTVKQGELLAEIWSKEVGEKKSDLVDALSQFYLHESLFRKVKKLDSTGAIAQRAIEEMQRTYEADWIQVERARRTLISWRIPEEELTAIEQEAKRIHAEAQAGPKAESTSPSSDFDPKWADLQVRSPIGGTILERNLTVGDIVDSNVDLFKVADLSRLLVITSLYEDDLPALLAIAPDRRTWTLHIDGRPPIPNGIEVVGNVVDPSQHTVVVQGSLDNSDGALRIGQFVEAVVPLAPPDDVWELSPDALIDQGAAASVFVARSADLTRWELCPVAVKRRTASIAWVTREGSRLTEGDQVLVRGCLPLADTYRELAPAHPSSN